eukprot:GHRR01006605.1.p1 GENE.GHRR01006605.1~~GHRR01006605.1.p1  ORF type:complete len:296 (+),score=135.61 GHRR01006605.1:680-1567(+)
MARPGGQPGQQPLALVCSMALSNDCLLHDLLYICRIVALRPIRYACLLYALSSMYVPAYLQEKMAVKEVWTRTSERAQANYALAAKLADKIGQRQAELMPMLSPGAGSGTASQQADNSNKLHQASQQQTVSTPISNNRGYSSSQARNINVDWSATGSGSKSASSAGSSKSSSTGNFYQFPWEKSIFEAQERVKQAERDAAVAGTRVAWQTRETLDEARDRLRSQAVESISSARSRIQRKAHESIEEAQARIAAEDAAVLQQVHQLVARYRAGGYVPEDEVEWAFRQLEKRAWRAM